MNPSSTLPSPDSEPPDRSSCSLDGDGAAAVELLSGPAEARAFWRMRRRVMATLLRQTLTEAWFRLLLITTLSMFLWAVLYWLSADGFKFLKMIIHSSDWHDLAVRKLFGSFFLALSAMLVVSSGIILYSALFRGPDLGLLLTMPARAERIFLHKFQEAILLSSWAFLLLGSPMIVAYGVVMGSPWYYFVLLLPMLIAFTYIPAAIGAMACLLTVRYLPRGRMLLLTIIVMLLAAAAAWGIWSVTRISRADMMTPNWFQDLLDRLSVADIRLLPSWWLTSGMLEAGRGLWIESLLFFTLLVSNALFFRQMAIWTAARIYRVGHNRLHAERAPSRQAKMIWLDRAVSRATSRLGVPIRLLIVKDLRLFRRDLAQWSQVVIFGLLLFFYFINIYRFHHNVFYAPWLGMVSFMNLSVVALFLSTFTTRFIFPMISLEGRRFWILGLLPIRRRTLVWSKFLFAICGSAIPCSGLILLSDLMLRMHPMIVASHQFVSLILCFGLAGIAVGLGAKVPNLREQSPSRIAAGFGGTLNLVLSALFIIVILVLAALPCHLYFSQGTSRMATWLANRLPLTDWLETWLIWGNIASVFVGLVAAVIPLWIGIRAFRKMQF